MKKQQQLGMNPSTASGRLVKDLLFSFIEKSGIKCYHCNEPMIRDNFSIEHKKPWLDSDDPIKNFFDLENISYSHKTCNFSAARKPNQEHFTEEEQKKNKLRLNREWYSRLPKETKVTRRKDKYKRCGN